jgi:eukaryotic-like serine/threonine-protein kinase
VDPYPTSAADELGQRVAAAVRAGAQGRDPLGTEFARARIRASVLEDRRSPLQLGRYVVLERVGCGGMGVVYAAYDPELDRKVALKVLHRAALGEAGERRPRLLREAQALAKLSHPNVITVYDVGSFDREPPREVPRWLGSATPTRIDEGAALDPSTPPSWMFVAMELIDGETVAKWLQHVERTTEDILRVMSDAGRGLAAAHAHGLVHRDFKPDNVMIDRDGRVRVMDFGLAASVSTADAFAAPAGGVVPDPRFIELRSTWSQHGGIIGTPAYMAPEQFLGAEVTAAADQFAFCVTCWEALHGHRPFAGESLPELYSALLEGELPPATKQARVPTWLRRVLGRGLATDPAKRWPSMAELLIALDRGRGQLRRRRAYAAVGAIAIAATAVVGVRALDQQRRAAACEREGTAIEAVWNPELRERVRTAVLASGLGYAEATAERLTPWLDTRAEAWAHQRTEACMDAELRGVLDAEAAERSQWCLEQRRLELDALVAELQIADAPFVQGSITAVATWVPIEPCRDPAELAAMQLPPLEHREAASEVGREIARALALRTAGKYDDGLVVVRDAIERAEAIGFAPSIASARVLEGSLLHRKGDELGAEQVVTAAYFQAARIGAWDTATNAAQTLISIVGVGLARPADGLAWAQHGEMAASHAPSRGGLRESMGKASVAVIQAQLGDYDAAVATTEAVLALREQLLGPEHPDLAVTLHNLGVLRSMLGDLVAARALFERALAIREQALGPEHPDLADTVDAVGAIDRELGDLAAARRYQERALAIRITAYGRHHRKIATSLSNIGSTAAASGDLDGAIDSYREALAVLEETVPADHPETAAACANLGGALLEAGELAPGRALLERAVAIFDRREGMQQNEAFARFELARALSGGSAAEQRRARELAEQALADHRAATREPETRVLEAWLADHPGLPR